MISTLEKKVEKFAFDKISKDLMQTILRMISEYELN